MTKSRSQKLPRPEQPDSPDELLRRCLQTPIDEQAWKEFFDYFFDTIKSAVKKTFLLKIRSGHEQLIHLSEEEVLDLVQMVFKRLVENDRQTLRDFRNDYHHSIYAYLNIISINVVMDFIDERTARKRPPLFFSLDDLQAEDEEEKVPLHKIVAQQNQQEVASQTPLITESMLDRALQEIPKGKNHQRDVIIFKLRVVKGMDFDDIVKIKGIHLSLSGARAAFNRILLKVQPVLREMLQQGK